MGKRKDCIAMILAGGRGERLGSLTNYMAKPTVPFGGKYKVIDFALSNCQHSGIDTVGVLTQYFSMELHSYINNNRFWNLLRGECDVYMCPSGINKGYYKGTADAVYKNIDFINHFSPENVLILSGDHVYKMDYRKLLDFHNKVGSDVTIASTIVPYEETSRYGILQVNASGLVLSFDEKPKKANSNLASMGIYLFRWDVLKKYLMADHKDERSKHDFGRDVIPEMFFSEKQIYAYLFEGYWRDIGMVDSLWKANMDLIDDPEAMNLDSNEWRIWSGNEMDEMDVSHSTLVNGNIIMKPCIIRGHVEHSLLYNSVIVGDNSIITDSIIMPNVSVGNNVRIHRAIIGMGTKIMDDVEIGSDYGMERFIDKKICSKGISLISPYTYINEGLVFKKNSHVDMTSNSHLLDLNQSHGFEYSAANSL